MYALFVFHNFCKTIIESGVIIVFKKKENRFNCY